ncbi:colicin D domain-containing protein [Haloferax elongans]|uniref:colicin D domain-containing protein n=1 Tax=Haloferax elongans TaxID=403191 RepID=UPI001F4C99E4|nr:colicin D domain-containing protein [Haloferax elongans]
MHVQRAKDLEHGKSGRDDREGIASELEFPDRQLQKKFKHAKRFGVNGSWNKENKNRFNMALINHIESPDTERISGTYRGEKVFHFYNSETKNNVITTRDGEFISGWTLSNKQEEHLTKSGDL